MMPPAWQVDDAVRVFAARRDVTEPAENEVIPRCFDPCAVALAN